MENKDLKNSSRRNFLKMSLLFGSGILAGSTVVKAVSENTDSQKVRLLATNGTVVEVNKEHIKPLNKEEQLTENQLKSREGIKGKKFVMVIDLSRCRNARMCTAACQNAHHLRPEQYHINTFRMQDAQHTAPYFMPKPCFHCDNPPCTKVCPVDATFKRQDGLVLIDNERCIGCRFCIAACPYSARSFNWFEPKNAEKDKDLVYNMELNVPQKKGTITKCLFSADCLRDGKLPYCVSSCPNSVFYFGDINEDAVTNGTTKQTVRFSELIRDNAGYTLMEELGTKPQVYYLPPKNRQVPFQYQGKTTIED